MFPERFLSLLDHVTYFATVLSNLLFVFWKFFSIAQLLFKKKETYIIIIKHLRFKWADQYVYLTMVTKTLLCCLSCVAEQKICVPVNFLAN